MEKGEVYESGGKRRVMVMMPDGLEGLAIDDENLTADLTDRLSADVMGEWVRLGTFNEVYPERE